MTDLPRLASLIKSRNTIDEKIATALGRPAQIGNVGACIAATIFQIALEDSGRSTGYDGHFTRGPLTGHSVDVQWRPRHDGLINIRQETLPDEYLLITGPEKVEPAIANPWLIAAVYLFNASDLLTALRERKVQIGSGTSITGPLWERAELYPVPRNQRLILSDEERKLLFLFS